MISRWLKSFDKAMDSGQSSHLTGFSLQSSSSWILTSSTSDLSKVHPSYLHLIFGSFSNIFSRATFLASVNFPRHSGHGLSSALSGSLQVLQSPCPFSQRYMGGSWMVLRHTGHSRNSATQSRKDRLAFLFLPPDAMVMLDSPIGFQELE